MGAKSSKLFHISSKYPIRIMILGLEASGKTTLLQNLKLGKITDIVPTIGWMVQSLEYKNVVMNAWDLEFEERIRNYGANKFDNYQGLIIIVDSADRNRIGDVKRELDRTLKMSELKGLPLLVFANKQDLKGMSIDEITKELELNDMKDRQWHIQGSCFVDGTGVNEGLDWLASVVKK